MMESKDLRIGNLVYKEGVRFSVEILHIAHTMNDIQPIPLTEEWLINFGFEYKSINLHVGSYSAWCFGNFELAKDMHDNYSMLVSPFSTVIHHVHQLQNLYYSLTGEELTIKK